MKFIDLDDSWGEGILQDWYIHSVNPDDKPQWTDEHIEELCNDFYVIPKETTKYDIDCNLNRLKELSEAYKDGRCLVLPCKVGTKELYIIDEYEEIYYLDADEVTIKRFPTGTIIFEYDSYELEYKDFGKTVFLTKEEAERALEERK